MQGRKRLGNWPEASPRERRQGWAAAGAGAEPACTMASAASPRAALWESRCTCKPPLGMHLPGQIHTELSTKSAAAMRNQNPEAERATGRLGRTQDTRVPAPHVERDTRVRKCGRDEPRPLDQRRLEAEELGFLQGVTQMQPRKESGRGLVRLGPVRAELGDYFFFLDAHK